MLGDGDVASLPEPAVCLAVLLRLSVLVEPDHRRVHSRGSRLMFARLLLASDVAVTSARYHWLKFCTTVYLSSFRDDFLASHPRG